MKQYLLPVFLLLSNWFNSSQSLAQNKNALIGNPVFVDQQGILRWTKTNKEAAFFGVNYTVPFAYGYRSHKTLHVNLKKAIDQDVYHFARLGLDAFRVHVWDTEISDSLGNLLENEHLDLFDYLIAQLEKRNIKILITPIAFWGNGYPDKDEKTGSFVSKYGKGPSVLLEEAFLAQERYLQQFFKHVNPYTKKTYGNHEGVIAMEINNEPHHSGPKARTTEYVNRMANAVRSTGWTKPIFYNISESPAYADAVAAANVDGFSFQWYPTGLVANRTLQGNYLPNVDEYKIPFGDTIPAFFGKARMVYEFDAGDVLQSNMYPAMARSFRSAGFQWATQFAYDPMATAYANTEYQTHYLNLAYTPSKAISLLIASKAFHELPLSKTYGKYPADTVFGNFRVSYKNNLSEYTGEEEFYYSSTTHTKHKQPARLKHIAGVGSSSIIKYSGTGAYFIDEVAEGIWRLEVMPDAIQIKDPFERASLQKTVTRIAWNRQQMELMLPGLGNNFLIVGLNAGNRFATSAKDKVFTIEPGTYLVKSFAKKGAMVKPSDGIIGFKEFVAPPKTPGNIDVVHSPFAFSAVEKTIALKANFLNLPNVSLITVEFKNSNGIVQRFPMIKNVNNEYVANVPAAKIKGAYFEYRFIVKKGSKTIAAFPATQNPYYRTNLVSKKAPIELFNPANDRGILNMYIPDWKNYKTNYTNYGPDGKLVLETSVTKAIKGEQAGFHLFVANKLQERTSELGDFRKLVIKANATTSEPCTIKLSLVTADAIAYSATVQVGEAMNEVEIPLVNLVPSPMVLLPRPYPGFLPLTFSAATSQPFKLSDIDKLEVMIQPALNMQASYTIAIESVYLKK